MAGLPPLLGNRGDQVAVANEQIASESVRDKIAAAFYDGANVTFTMENATSSATDQNNMSFNERLVFVFLLSIGTILTLFGNVMICVAVIMVKKLRRTHNAFYVNLAAADIFVALVMIHGVITLIHEAPIDDKSADADSRRSRCMLWLSLDLMSSITVILSIAALTAHMHIHIIYPFKYEELMAKKWLIACILASIWAISASVAFVPIHLGWQTGDRMGVDIRSRTEIGVCRNHSNAVYVAMVTTVGFCIPSFLICALNFRLYHHSQYHYSNIKKTSSMCSSLNAFSVNNTGAVPTPTPTHYGNRNFVGESFNLGTRSMSCVNHQMVNGSMHAAGNSIGKRVGSNLNRWLSRSQNLLTMQGVLMSSQRMLAQLPLGRLKAIRTLGCMTVSFLICWGAFYITLIINSLMPVKDRTWIIILLVAYYNACLNPLIYTRFNHDFQRGIASLFCQRTVRERSSYDESTESRRRRGSVPCIAPCSTALKQSNDDNDFGENRMRRVYSCSALI